MRTPTRVAGRNTDDIVVDFSIGMGIFAISVACSRSLESLGPNRQSQGNDIAV